ncbi:hypothetical protein V8C44DRAFT_294846 [Trichoderma aethiopicum]
MYLILSREPVLMTLRMLTESAARSSPRTAHPLPIAREGRRTKSPTLGQLISKPRLSPRKTTHAVQVLLGITQMLPCLSPTSMREMMGASGINAQEAHTNITCIPTAVQAMYEHACSRR